MTPTDKHDPWAHFDEAFRHFDRGWRSVDRGFDAAGSSSSFEAKDKFALTASTWRSRWKLFCVFNRVAWRLLLRGKVTIRL